jgi:transglutaminase superfamily protein
MTWLTKALRPCDLSKLRARSFADRCLLGEAVFWLAIAGAAIPAIPFRWTRRFFALKQGSAGTVPGPEMRVLARRVGWAVRTASTRTPWQNACLARSLAGAAMLRRRGIPADVVMGVANIGGGAFTAHAWLSSGGDILTGGRGHEGYRVIANFTLD